MIRRDVEKSLRNMFERGYKQGYKEALNKNKGEWIPVTKRLPEEPYACLVTVWDTNVLTQEEFENVLPYPIGYDGETWNDGDGNICPFEVIAWMPAPEPYKAESEDK